MIDIKAIRKNRKLSQNDFGAIFNVSQSFISQIENGDVEIPDDWKDVLEEKFGDLRKFTKKDKEVISNNISDISEYKDKYLTLLEEIAEERKQKNASIIQKLESIEAFLGIGLINSGPLDLRIENIEITVETILRVMQLVLAAVSKKSAEQVVEQVGNISGEVLQEIVNRRTAPAGTHVHSS